MCIGFEAVQTSEQPLSKSSKESLGRYRCEHQPTGPEPKDPPPEGHLWNFLQEDSEFECFCLFHCFCHSVREYHGSLCGFLGQASHRDAPARCPQVHPEVEKDIQGSYRLLA